jgi:hypothetical protein
MRTLAERLWARVNMDGPPPDRRPELGPCWLWTGAINKHTGYGIIRVAYKQHGDRVHRVVYELEVGPISPGKLVMHECDVKRCCRPSHLRVGTQAENLAQARERGLHAFGERAGNAVLTEAKVREARGRVVAGEELSSVARELGVGRGALDSAAHGVTWGHVPGAIPDRRPYRRIAWDE